MLDETLLRIRETVEGVRAALVVGLDGMIVASSAEDGEDDDVLEVIAANYPDLLRKVASANDEAGLDGPRELIVGTGSATLVLRGVTDAYALLTLLGPRGSLGRVRFEMRRAADALRPELEP